MHRTGKKTEPMSVFHTTDLPNFIQIGRHLGIAAEEPDFDL